MGHAGAAVGDYAQVQQFHWSQAQLGQQSDRITPALPNAVVGQGVMKPQDLGIADRVPTTPALDAG